MKSNMMETCTTIVFDEMISRNQDEKCAIGTQRHRSKYELINQELSDIQDLKAFNNWVENDDCETMGSSHYIYQENTELLGKLSKLRKIIHDIEDELYLKKLGLELALVERDFLLAQSHKTKKFTTELMASSKETEIDQVKPIRINGVSRRRGSYTNIMHQLAQSPLFCAESNPC